MNLLEINVFILGFGNPVAMKLLFSRNLWSENYVRITPNIRFFGHGAVLAGIILYSRNLTSRMVIHLQCQTISFFSIF